MLNKAKLLAARNYYTRHKTTLGLFVTAVVLAATSALACHAAHNITAILSGRWDLAEFSRELATTGLPDDINGRSTITVLAVDDAHMAPLKARGLPRETLPGANLARLLVGVCMTKATTIIENFNRTKV